MSKLDNPQTIQLKGINYTTKPFNLYNESG